MATWDAIVSTAALADVYNCCDVLLLQRQLPVRCLLCLCANWSNAASFSTLRIHCPMFEAKKWSVYVCRSWLNLSANLASSPAKSCTWNLCRWLVSCSANSMKHLVVEYFVEMQFIVVDHWLLLAWFINCVNADLL